MTSEKLCGPLDVRALVCHMLEPLAPEIYQFSSGGTMEKQKSVFVGHGFRITSNVATKTKKVEVFINASSGVGATAAKQVARRVAEWTALATTALSIIAQDGGITVDIYNPRRAQRSIATRRRSRSCE